MRIQMDLLSTAWGDAMGIADRFRQMRTLQKVEGAIGERPRGEGANRNTQHPIRSA